MNDVGFIISEEDLASGPGTRLDHSRAFVQQSFIKVKRDRERSDTDIRRGTEGASPASFGGCFKSVRKLLISETSQG